MNAPMPPLPFPNLEPAEIRARLDAGEKLVLIDVREDKEWALCHIEGAELKPMSKTMDWWEGLPKDGGPYVLYCHHGVRSARVGLFLHQQGLTDVINMAGGIHRWSQTVDPDVPMY